MKTLLTIAALASLSALVHAECRCVNHTPEEHINLCDADTVAYEAKETPKKVAGDIKEGVTQMTNKIGHDLKQANQNVQNSQSVQSLKEATECMCDKTKCELHHAKEKANSFLEAAKEKTVCLCNSSKCMMHRAKDKAHDAAIATKDAVVKAGQLAKEVAVKAGHAIKETVYKVGHDVQEGATELKDDVVETHERMKQK